MTPGTGVPIGTWLLAIGIPFAIWPTRMSHIADRLLLRDQNQVTPRQVRYARFAGTAIATAGALMLVTARVN